MGNSHHKFFIGGTSIMMLLIGLLLGVFFTPNAEFNFELVNFALLLVAIVLLLMIGGLILEMNSLKNSKKRRV